MKIFKKIIDYVLAFTVILVVGTVLFLYTMQRINVSEYRFTIVSNGKLYWTNTYTETKNCIRYLSHYGEKKVSMHNCGSYEIVEGKLTK